MRRWRPWLGFLAATLAAGFGATKLRHRWQREMRIERLEPNAFAVRVVDLYGRPIEGAYVEIRSRRPLGHEGFVTGGGITDEEGRVRLHGLRELPYHLTVVPADSPLRYDGPDGARLPDVGFPTEARFGAGSVIVVDAVFRRLGGRVVDERGAPVAGARVQVRRGDGIPSEGELSLVTDADGRLPPTLVPSGRYLAEVTTGEPGRSHEASLLADGPDATIVLPDVTTLEGTLSDFPSYTTVQLVAKDSRERLVRVTGTSFALASVPRGDVVVAVLAGSAIDVQTVHVEPPATATVHLAARPVVPVVGHVDFDEAGSTGLWAPFCEASVLRPEGAIGPLPVRVGQHGDFALVAPIGTSIEVRCATPNDVQTGRAWIDKVRCDQASPIRVAIRPGFE